MGYMRDSFPVDCGLVKDILFGIIKGIPRGVGWGVRKAICPRRNTFRNRIAEMYDLKGRNYAIIPSFTEIIVSEIVRLGIWSSAFIAGAYGADYLIN